MTDLFIGLIFASILIVGGAFVIAHSKKTREAMFKEMDRLEKLEEERLKAEAEAKAKAKEAKPAPKKRRGRPKKNNGKKEMD